MLERVGFPSPCIFQWMLDRELHSVALRDDY
jgi:hypothetical protein